MHYCPKVSVEDLASVSILEEQEEEDSQADTISTTKEAGEIMLALAAAGRSNFSTHGTSSDSAASSTTMLPPSRGQVHDNKIIAESCNMPRLMTAAAKSSLPFGTPPQKMPAEMGLGTSTTSMNSRFVQHNGKADKLFQRGMHRLNVVNTSLHCIA